MNDTNAGNTGGARRPSPLWIDRDGGFAIIDLEIAQPARDAIDARVDQLR